MVSVPFLLVLIHFIKIVFNNNSNQNQLGPKPTETLRQPIYQASLLKIKTKWIISNNINNVTYYTIPAA